MDVPLLGGGVRATDTPTSVDVDWYGSGVGYPLAPHSGVRAECLG